jgi:uncharacterized RDD family membrane protein YckC
MDPQQPPAPQPPSPQPPMGGPLMSSPPPGSWQSPPTEPGPAPGVRFAGFGARLVAYIIDNVLLVVFAIILSIVLAAVIGVAAAGNNAGAAIGGSLLLVLLLLVVYLAYFPYFWVNGGQTPGMKMVNIRVVRDADGGPLTWGSAILRLIGYWINGVVLYIGFIWVFIDKRRRGWHDLIAGTVVIDG